MGHMSAHREIPEALEHVIAMKKGEIDGKLSRYARDVNQYLIKQKGLRTQIINYLASLDKAVDCFRQAPMDAYARLKERDRRKFTKEINEITEHPIHLGHILKLFKTVNEMLELMLEGSGFFGFEGHGHGHASHAPTSNGHHATHAKPQHKVFVAPHNATAHKNKH